MRSYVADRSKAPPSLKVSLSETARSGCGMPPPGTGRRMPSQTLGPKKGAATCVSWRERRGVEKEVRVGWGCLGWGAAVGARPRIGGGVAGR